MATLVRDLMSSPAITAGVETTLTEAGRKMAEAQTGSVIVTGDGGKVVGILTERDLLRAAAAGADPNMETTRLWMTEHPDVLGPEEEAGAAWSSLTHHHYRHLPVVDAEGLVGVVSLRDLMGIALIRPATEQQVSRGLEGVVVAETAVGDVRGREGFYHYRQYSATELAQKRSFEDVWYLMLNGDLPTRPEAEAFESQVRSLRAIPNTLNALLPSIVADGSVLDVLRTAVSVLGAEAGFKPTHDIDGGELHAQLMQIGSVVPTILAQAHRLRLDLEAVSPREDLGHAANYLWMLTGEMPTEEHARAIEQYMILAIDHGFNASTFTARVIVSTGADLAAAVCGAIGALSGPLHGGAPSRALDMLEQIGSADKAEAWLRDAVIEGRRLMGFGHRVYKTEDPRSAFLRDVARSLDARHFELANQIEQVALRVLAELKPERELCTNVEFYAGVVMDACGIPPDMFTPTFAAARTVGWSAHIAEQAADNRLIRPAARYAGPPAPQPVYERG
ncbi:MAG: citrate synthase [Acidimicrobiales bacterium]